jgi:hypothetical protein
VKAISPVCTLVVFVVLCVLACNSAQAQRLTIFAGAKLPEFKKSNLELAYIDESPDPDVFYSNVQLKDDIYYSIGASYDNYGKISPLYYNVIGNAYFGDLFGLDIGASGGYPLYLTKTKSMSVIPAVTAGISYLSKGMGTLVNNTVYIQVNDTRFGDHQNVDISLTKMGGFVKPNLSFVLDITEKYQLRVMGAYMFDFAFKESIDFSGKDNSGNPATASEDVNASNLSYSVDGKTSKDIPFNMNGFEVKLGIGIRL